MNENLRLYVVAPIIGALFWTAYNSAMIFLYPRITIFGVELTRPWQAVLYDFTFVYLIVAFANMFAWLFFGWRNKK